MTSETRRWNRFALAALWGGLALFAPHGALAQRQFKTKDCMECHQKFAGVVDKLKYSTRR